MYLDLYKHVTVNSVLLLSEKQFTLWTENNYGQPTIPEVSVESLLKDWFLVAIKNFGTIILVPDSNEVILWFAIHYAAQTRSDPQALKLA